MLKFSVCNIALVRQIASVLSFASSLETWSSESVTKITDFLTGSDDAVMQPISDFPLLPELLEGAVSLLPGGKLALLVKGAVPFIKGFLTLKEKLRPTDPVRILDKALLKETWWLPGSRRSWLQELSEKMPMLVDGKLPVNVDLSALIESLSAQDCNNTSVSIAQVLFRALGECRDIGGELTAYYGLFDALQGLAAAIAGISIQIETEKAARVSASGIDAQSDIQFPG